MPTELVDRLQNIAPKQNVVFIAMARLKSVEEIEEFYIQYSKKLGSKAAARQDIDACLGYCHEKYSKTWRRALKVIDAYPRRSKQV